MAEHVNHKVCPKKRLLTADCRSNKLWFPVPRYAGASHAYKPFTIQYSSGSRNVVTLLSASVIIQNFTPVLSL